MGAALGPARARRGRRRGRFGGVGARAVECRLGRPGRDRPGGGHPQAARVAARLRAAARPESAHPGRPVRPAPGGTPPHRPVRGPHDLARRLRGAFGRVRAHRARAPTAMAASSSTSAARRLARWTRCRGEPGGLGGGDAGRRSGPAVRHDRGGASPQPPGRPGRRPRGVVSRAASRHPPAGARGPRLARDRWARPRHGCPPGRAGRGAAGLRHPRQRHEPRPGGRGRARDGAESAHRTQPAGPGPLRHRSQGRPPRGRSGQPLDRRPRAVASPGRPAQGVAQRRSPHRRKRARRRP